jgi:hypothetical protein
MKSSKRIKFNPFGKQTTTLVPVTQHENGRKVWFAKQQITPDTNPVDLQELQRKQARISSLLFVAGNELSRQKDITTEDARKMFFPQTLPNPKYGEASQPKSIQVEAELNFIDYLSEAQLEEFLMLQNEAAALPVLSATVFLQNRLAFDMPVSIGGTGSMKTEGLWFELAPGDRVKFGDKTVTVLSVDESGTDFAEVKFSESTSVSMGEVGFLVDAKGDYVLGDSSWDEAQTRSVLSVSQINAIYQFYDSCLNDREIDKGIEAEGKGVDLTNSSSMQTPHVLTGGEASIQNVAPSESQPKTTDLDIEALVSAQ